MARRPNFVLINCDDLGYGDLGCYGSPVHDTARLDRMAAEGVQLTSFYMASPVCSPSRGAMLTGSYPPRIGFAGYLDSQVPVIAQGVQRNPFPGFRGQPVEITPGFRPAIVATRKFKPLREMRGSGFVATQQHAAIGGQAPLR